MLSPEDYTRLPGPVREIRDIAGDLRSGRSVVVVFPDHLVNNGTADAVVDELMTLGDRAYFCDTSESEPFPTRILATFGVDGVANRDYDSWETIIRCEAWHGAWVVLSGWDHSDVATVIDRWPPQLHACSLSVQNRPKLVLAARLSDVQRGVVTRHDHETMAVHWWWGVLDRLDTETRLASIAGRRLNIVEAAVVAEVAGWDLECVDYLFEHWDRTTAGLPAAVRSYRAGAPPASTDSLVAVGAATAIPSVELEGKWRDGLIDRWGHSLRPSPLVLSEKDTEQRLWAAHNRTLIPLVDEERAVYEEILLSAARPHALDDLRRRDDEIIEIGSLAWLATTGRVTIDRRKIDRLCAFRDLRNALAHRIPVNDNLQKRIVKYLDL